MVMKKMLSNLNVPQNISSYCYSFHTSSFGSEVHEDFKNIWQHFVGEQICSLVDDKIRYSYISHRLTCMIAFFKTWITSDTVWLSFAFKKTAKTLILVCATRGKHFRWNDGVWSHFWYWIHIIISTNL